MIDAHLHLWRLDRGDDDWLRDEDPALRRDATLQEWTGLAHRSGWTALLVQAAPTAAETAYVMDLAASDPRAAARICDAEPSAPVALRPWLQAIDDPTG